jgi:flagellar hook-associated protein 2
MQSISFGGLASGLDTTAIINALVGAREIPMTLVQNKKANAETKLNLMNTLKGLVTAVQTKAKALQDLGGFLSHTITPSAEGVANFSVTGTPQPGSHSLKVMSLANAETVGSVGVADKDAQMDGGTISFDYNGTGYSIVIDPSNSSIESIAEAINSQAGDAVSASVVNTGTSSSPSYELVIKGNDTGADYSIDNLQVASLAPPAPGLADNLSFNAPLVEASNAVIELDGLTIQRESNDFTDVLEGIKIEAIAADPTKTITFGVSIDEEGIKEKLTEFVSAYNEVMTFINKQNKYSEDKGAGGALFGDKLLQSVRNKMYSGFVEANASAVQADTTGYSSLSLLGIKITVDGSLEIDDAKLTSKMNGNIEAFSDFFSAEGTGAFSKLSTNLDYLLDSTGNDVNGAQLDSLFDIRTESLNGTIADYADTIDDMQYQLDKYQESLVSKFANLELLMGQLQAQGSAVDNLSSLNFDN